ncbi:MAG: Cas9 inhibitor AcrIIA9 family protein [Christensenellales bacterium]|nr:Cas9 inhibitor AcrIIA9 family protein [Christensenellales bacterium]
MTKLNLEATSREQEIVKTYLEENASETLAEKINNGTPVEKDGKQLINRKTLDGFMRYACDEARKLAAKGASSACVEDMVVFGWAIHYFEEDSIEGTLYNADGTEYKPVRTPASTPTTTVKAVAKPQPAPQMTLFDFMEKEDGETTGTNVENEPESEEEDELPSAEEIDEILAEIDGEDGAQKYPENVDMETGEILPENAEKSEPSVSPYEPEALRILQEIFGDEMVLR